MKAVSLNDISIRTELREGDIGYVIYRHGILYKEEYGWGIGFESYVAAGLHEFYSEYDPSRERVWICEHNGKIIGFSLLKSRGDAAQLRYFLIEPECRGIGLGGKLMNLFMGFARERGYKSSYLLTTSDLQAAAHLYKSQGFVLTEETLITTYGKPVISQKYEMKFV